MFMPSLWGKVNGKWTKNVRSKSGGGWKNGNIWVKIKGSWKKLVEKFKGEDFSYLPYSEYNFNGRNIPLYSKTLGKYILLGKGGGPLKILDKSLSIEDEKTIMGGSSVTAVDIFTNSEGEEFLLFSSSAFSGGMYTAKTDVLVTNESDIDKSKFKFFNNSDLPNIEKDGITVQPKIFLGNHININGSPYILAPFTSTASGAFYRFVNCFLIYDVDSGGVHVRNLFVESDLTSDRQRNTVIDSSTVFFEDSKEVFCSGANSSSKEPLSLSAVLKFELGSLNLDGSVVFMPPFKRLVMPSHFNVPNNTTLLSKTPDNKIAFSSIRRGSGLTDTFVYKIDRDLNYIGTTNIDVTSRLSGLAKQYPTSEPSAPYVVHLTDKYFVHIGKYLEGDIDKVAVAVYELDLTNNTVKGTQVVVLDPAYGDFGELPTLYDDKLLILKTGEYTVFVQ